MIVTLLYKVTWKVLSAASVLLRREAVKDAELLVLRHEDTVLRRQLTSLVRYEPADRFWFAALSRLIHRSRWREVFPVTAGTTTRVWLASRPRQERDSPRCADLAHTARPR